MKFLLVAPRFHTNQVPIVKLLIDQGHEVEFFAQYIGKSEDHSLIRPYLMKKSIISKALYKRFNKKYDENLAENMKMIYFLPSVSDLFKKIKRYSPDVVILRNRNLTSLVAYFLCKLLKINSVILYNQTPLYTLNEHQINFKKLLKKFIIRNFFPKVRITPVITNNTSEFKNNQGKQYIKENDYFVPFIAEVNQSAESRNYCKNGNINILDVGKYRDYKNHFLLVDAIDLIKDKNNLKVTIAGQVVNKEEKKYFDSLKNYIKEKRLEEIIELKKNIAYSKMNQLYKENDVLILTSKKEVASISILEAMGNGMVVISTDANGTASYIKDGDCGYIFRTMDAEDLAEKVESVISSKENIQTMGKDALENLKNNYTFKEYYLALGKVIDKEFGITLNK